MAERMMNKIHVLLVEHDMNSCAQTVAVLEYFSYIVTPVQLASQAAALICEGVHPFDMLIQNINSPDAHGYMLITEAVKMQLPVILLVDEEDTMLTKTALEGGVFLCVRRPVSPDMAKYLWQYAARETFTRFFQDPSMGYRENGGHGLENHDEGEGVRYVQDGSVFCHRKKVWTEWTQELHDKFMEAVVMLGEGRCYPKDILDLMKVPGLTRMQVASHLQKCRTGSWQPPNGRRTRATRQKSASTSGRSRRNRFGCMPNAPNNDSNRTPAQTQQNDNTQFPMNHHPVPEPEPEPNMGIGDNAGEWRSQLQEGMIHLEPQDQTEYNPMMNHVAVEAFNTAHYDLGLGSSEAQGGQQMQMQMQLDESFAYPTLDYSMQRIQYSESTQGMDLDQQYFNQQPPPGLYPF